MKKVVIIAAASFFLFSMVAVGSTIAADSAKGAGVAKIGKTPLEANKAESLKGRVYAQWADNPDGEILFGILYWNDGEPASGDPSGRTSTQMEVRPPDPLFSCCAWGFTGGTEKNNPYSGHYSPGSTVRLKVKDKALMDQLIKASQDLVAMEVNLDGRTITGFKVLEAE